MVRFIRFWTQSPEQPVIGRVHVESAIDDIHGVDIVYQLMEKQGVPRDRVTILSEAEGRLEEWKWVIQAMPDQLALMEMGQYSSYFGLN